MMQFELVCFLPHYLAILQPQPKHAMNGKAIVTCSVNIMKQMKYDVMNDVTYI